MLESVSASVHIFEALETEVVLNVHLHVCFNENARRRVGASLAVGAEDLRLLHRAGGAQAAARCREEGVVLPRSVARGFCEFDVRLEHWKWVFFLTAKSIPFPAGSQKYSWDPARGDMSSNQTTHETVPGAGDAKISNLSSHCLSPSRRGSAADFAMLQCFS